MYLYLLEGEGYDMGGKTFRTFCRGYKHKGSGRLKKVVVNTHIRGLLIDEDG